MELLLAKRLKHKKSSIEDVIKILENNLYGVCESSIHDKEYLNEEILKFNIIGELNTSIVNYRDICTANGVPQFVIVKTETDVNLCFLDDERIELKKDELFTCMFCLENSFHTENGEIINATFVV